VRDKQSTLMALGWQETEVLDVISSCSCGLRLMNIL
jgi:hypothetical protein